MNFAMDCFKQNRRARRRLLHAAILVHGMACVNNSLAQDAQIESKPAVVVRVAESITTLPPFSGNIHDTHASISSTQIANKANRAAEVKSDLSGKSNAATGRAPQLYKKPGNHISVASNQASSLSIENATSIIAPAHPPEIQVVEAPSFLPLQNDDVLLIPQLPLPVKPVSVSSDQRKAPVLPNIVSHSHEEASLASVETARFSDIQNSDKITIYQRRMTSSTFDKKVVKTVSFDESTCKSFIVDSHNIALLGVKTGQVRIEVIFDDGSSSTKLVSVESPVYRGEPVNQNEKISSLTQSLADMYPNASIELSVISGGAIAVRGEVKNEIDARDIMVLVRQMFLVPIQDKLIVRNR